MDKVAQLVKLAKDEHAGKKSLAAGAAASVLAGMAPSRILGYHNAYHGTAERKNANSIREKGLKKSKGGTGVSAADDIRRTAGTTDNKSRSRGKIYMSKNPVVAKHYTQKFFQTDSKNVIHAKIPHSQFHKAVHDKLVQKLNKEQGLPHSDKAIKNVAFMSDKSVPPTQIVGSSKYKGVKQYATKKNLSHYLKTPGGKTRFASGIASALGSAGLAGYALKKYKEKKKAA